MSSEMDLDVPKDKKEDKKEEEDAPIEEEFAPHDPLLKLADLRFMLTLPSDLCGPTEKQGAVNQIIEIVKKDSMAPFYQFFCGTHSSLCPLDQSLLSSLEQENEKEKKTLEDKLEDAKKNHGDIEVLEANMANAAFLARIGDKAKSFAAYEECLEKTIGAGQRIDVVFTLIRMSLFWGDSELLKKHIEKAKVLVEKEGDWERRNKLGVYRAVNHILNREFNEACKLLLDSIATFTCTELFDYDRFVFFTICCALVGTDRVTLKEKVLKSPDVIQVLDDTHILRRFMSSFHKCDYTSYFRCLSEVADLVCKDKYFSVHAEFFIKEARVKAYQQFLQSYKSVTLQSMASAFGISVEFLDRELSRFIAANRIIAKIDRVSSIVETKHADLKNEHFATVLKEGDILLNRVQKLNQTIRTA